MGDAPESRDSTEKTTVVLVDILTANFSSTVAVLHPGLRARPMQIFHNLIPEGLLRCFS